MSDYESIVNRSWDDLQEPSTLPVGSYTLRVGNIVFRAGEGDRKSRVMVFYSVREPMDDVDLTALSDLGADYDITQNEVVKTFWIEKDRDWIAVKDHLRLLGVDPSGQSIAESFKAAKGAEVVGYLDIREYTDQNGQLKQVNDPVNFAPIG